MKETKRSDGFSRDDTEEFIEAWIHGRVITGMGYKSILGLSSNFFLIEKKKRQRRKEDCWRRRKKFEEDWSSLSSRILSSSSSPSILADVIIVAVSLIHLRRSPSSP
ncbi:hypothetical protein YC2023_009992 [Brassica napus]